MNLAKHCFWVSKAAMIKLPSNPSITEAWSGPWQPQPDQGFPVNAGQALELTDPTEDDLIYVDELITQGILVKQ